MCGYCITKFVSSHLIANIGPTLPRLLDKLCIFRIVKVTTCFYMIIENIYNAVHVIDLIIDLGECNDDHTNEKVGKVLYRVLWFGYEPEEDTWKPINHLRLQKVLSYYRVRSLVPPPKLMEQPPVDDSMHDGRILGRDK